MQQSGLRVRSRKMVDRENCLRRCGQKRKLLRRCFRFDQSNRPEGAAAMGRRRSRGNSDARQKKAGWIHERGRSRVERGWAVPRVLSLCRCVQCSVCCPCAGVCSAVCAAGNGGSVVCAVPVKVCAAGAVGKLWVLLTMTC